MLLEERLSQDFLVVVLHRLQTPAEQLVLDWLNCRISPFGNGRDRVVGRQQCFQQRLPVLGDELPKLDQVGSLRITKRIISISSGVRKQKK